jgi:LmbE family N-acetylglucosaminyl deacetylase
MARFILLGLLVVLIPHVPAREATPDLDTGHTALGLALRRLATTGTLMMATAHPDDENNALLAMVSRGLGIRTTLATATRGDGGQNEIGPELFDALAALRTEELLAAHRFDGAEQFFTRAVDFGYSFSVEETLERWGRDEILGDYVRLIRMIRPDVIVALRPDGAGGGQHHQASARLAREAFRAVGDPSRFPGQLRDGLRAWQPKKFYFTASFGFRGEPPPDAGKKLVTIDLETYDPLLGRTYAEIGSQARAMHKCQGFGQLLALPGNAFVRYELADTTIEGQREAHERSLFDGLDLTILTLATYAGRQPAADLSAELQLIAAHVKNAQRTFDSGGDAGTVAPLAAGLAAVRALRRRLPSAALDDMARYEIDFRLAQKERQFEETLVLAQRLRIELLADDGLVVEGQPITLTTIIANRGDRPLDVKELRLAGLEGAACAGQTVRAPDAFTCGTAARIPADVPLTGVHWKRRPDADRYDLDPEVPFGVPFAPSPFRAQLTLDIGGVDVRVDRPIEYRYEGSILSGEKRMELKVVPAFSLSVDPAVAVIGRTPAGREREVRVTVTNRSKGAASSGVSLQVPKGWRAEPPRASVSFSREDEARTTRFTVHPPSGVRPGSYALHATVDAAGGSAVAGLGAQVIEYPHIQRRHLLQPAAVDVKTLDVRIAPNLRVGYITGVGDQLPQAIEQLGASVEMIGADDLAWGDLSRFDVIVTGVRAYERRADLRAHNQRLLDYAARGGIVIVQYNKFEFNEAQYGPYPAKVSSTRITDERAPVTVLVPDHPVFHRPNEIDADAWEGWVQERGLYFLGDRTSEYVDLVEMTDPFEHNRGPKRGALVEAKVGKGRWMYVGLGLWRQLPAGTPGAYELLANLLSLGR